MKKPRTRKRDHLYDALLNIFGMAFFGDAPGPDSIRSGLYIVVIVVVIILLLATISVLAHH